MLFYLTEVQLETILSKQEINIATVYSFARFTKWNLIMQSINRDENHTPLNDITSLTNTKSKEQFSY